MRHMSTSYRVSFFFQLKFFEVRKCINLRIFYLKISHRLITSWEQKEYYVKSGCIPISLVIRISVIEGRAPYNQSKSFDKIHETTVNVHAIHTLHENFKTFLSFSLYLFTLFFSSFFFSPLSFLFYCW